MPRRTRLRCAYVALLWPSCRAGGLWARPTFTGSRSAASRRPAIADVEFPFQYEATADPDFMPHYAAMADLAFTIDGPGIYDVEFTTSNVHRTLHLFARAGTP